jgi:hypothetical protein
LRAPRANHVFGTDEKRIRSENMVIDKSTNRFRLSLSKILDPRGRAAVRASSGVAARSKKGLPMSSIPIVANRQRLQ